MNQKIIITFLVIFLVVNFSWVSFTEKKQRTIKGQWFLYFQNPTDNNFNFIIENYTDNAMFNWKLLNNNIVVESGKVEVLKGSKKTVIIKKENGNQLSVTNTEKGDKFIYKHFVK